MSARHNANTAHTEPEVGDTQLSGRELVVLVHGTFASATDDTGSRWWQRGSFFWRNMESKLPSNVRLPDSLSLFRWSGKNHYRSRYVAGNALFDYLRELDEQNINYHVIAHSHGGTVLWHALQIAFWSERVDRRLTALRASYRNPLRIKDWFKRSKSQRESSSDCTLGLPGLRSCIAVGSPFTRLRQRSHSFMRSGLADVVTATIAFGVPIALAAILWSSIGPFALFAGLLFFPLMWIATLTALPTKFSATTSLDSGLGRELGARWLSVWSEHDEALNLLRLARRVSDEYRKHKYFSVFGAPMPIIPYEQQTSWSRFIFAAETLYIKTFKRFIVPWLNKYAAGQFAERCFGLPFFGRVAAVEPFPCEGLQKPSCLSQQTIEELKRNADKYLAESATGIRESLTEAALGLGGNPLEAIFTAGDKLVHTSYFSNDSVVDLIVEHIMANAVRP